MSKYIVNKTEDGMWAVEDELNSVIDIVETRAKARDLVRQLMEPKSNVTHVEGTYGTGIEREEVVEKVDEQASEVAVVSPVETVAVVAVEPLVSDKPLRKSDQVRYRIRIAKQNNESESVVVQWAIDVLGMKKPLATTYVKSNWHKA